MMDSKDRKMMNIVRSQYHYDKYISYAIADHIEELVKFVWLFSYRYILPFMGAYTLTLLTVALPIHLWNQAHLDGVMAALNRHDFMVSNFIIIGLPLFALFFNISMIPVCVIAFIVKRMIEKYCR